MSKRAFSIACVVCFFAMPSFGQQGQPPAGPAPATKESIQKLFTIMHIRQQMTLVIDSVMKQQTTMIHDTMKKRFPRISEQELARFDTVMQESTKDMPIEGMLDDMVPIYQKYLNATDVKAMTVFYSSPTGKKLMQKLPAMTSEAMQASQTRLQAQMEKTMQRIDEMMREEPPASAKPQ